MRISTAENVLQLAKLKTTKSSILLLRERFQEYRCELDILIFAWRLLRNYAYSPFKLLGRIKYTYYLNFI